VITLGGIEMGVIMEVEFTIEIKTQVVPNRFRGKERASY